METFNLFDTTEQIINSNKIVVVLIVLFVSVVFASYFIIKNIVLLVKGIKYKDNNLNKFLFVFFRILIILLGFFILSVFIILLLQVLNVNININII